MSHRARPLFLPHRQGTYIAVRPFNWRGQRFEPGEVMPELPLHHMRHLHAQSMIGPADEEWSEQRIAHWAKRLADGRKRSEARTRSRLKTLEARAERADQAVEAAVATAKEVRSLKDRIAGLFGGGRSHGDGSAASSHPA